MLLGKKIIGTVGYMGGVITLPEPFVNSYVQMIQYNNDYLLEPGEQILYTRTTNSYHSFARNNLVKGMRGDWLFQMDTDHAFDPDILARMIHSMYKYDIQVLSGIYQYRGEPFAPKTYRFTKGLKSLEIVGKWSKMDGKYFLPVDSVGAGCLLVRKSVYDTIKKKFKEEPFDIIPPFSEDNSFFLRLKKLGIPVYCDPSIEYRHLYFKEITMKDYQPEKIPYFKKYKIK